MKPNNTIQRAAMAGLFDTAADQLPDELQDLRQRLWGAYGDDQEAIGPLLKLIDAMGFKPAQAAFESLVAAEVIRLVGNDQFQMNKDA